MFRRAAFVVAALSWAACSPPKSGVAVAPLRGGAPLERYEQTRPSMGGFLRIVIVAPDGRDDKVDEAFEKAFGATDHWESLLSEWKPDSPVSKVNAAAGKEPVVVPDEVLDAFEKSFEVSHASHGAFDVSWAGLDGLWDFKSDAHRVPTEAERAEARSHVDWSKIVVDRKAHTVFLPDAKMKVGFGGIGQGIGADAAALALRDEGFDDFCVDESGDDYFAGDAGGRPWKAAIQDPRGERGKTVASVQLRDEALTTAGDYEKYFIGADGVRYHHIMDPRTGAPARGFASVSVIAPTTTDADGYDDAVFAAGSTSAGVAVLLARKLQGVLITAPEDNGGKSTLMVTTGLKGRIDLSGWSGEVAWLEGARR